MPGRQEVQVLAGDYLVDVLDPVVIADDLTIVGEGSDTTSLLVNLQSSGLPLDVEIRSIAVTTAGLASDRPDLTGVHLVARSAAIRSTSYFPVSSFDVEDSTLETALITSDTTSTNRIVGSVLIGGGGSGGEITATDLTIAGGGLSGERVVADSLRGEGLRIRARVVELSASELDGVALSFIGGTSTVTDVTLTEVTFLSSPESTVTFTNSSIAIRDIFGTAILGDLQFIDSEVLVPPTTVFESFEFTGGRVEFLRSTFAPAVDGASNVLELDGADASFVNSTIRASITVRNADVTAVYSTLEGNLDISSGGTADLRSSLVRSCSGGSITSDSSVSVLDGCGSRRTSMDTLGGLADNGGPTRTIAIIGPSVLLDFGNPDDCPATDQRGVPRGFDGDGVNGGGCDVGAYESETLFPNEAPTAAFTAEVEGGGRFDAVSSTDSDGVVVSYEWSFGDGTNEVTDVPVISHVFPASGEYEVSLVVVDEEGARSAPSSQKFTVSDGSQLVADFTVGEALSLLPTSLDASASGDPFGIIVEYQWDFGDGTTNTSTNPVIEHVFPAQAVATQTYAVELTVVTALGFTASTTQQVEVVHSGPVALVAPIDLREGQSVLVTGTWLQRPLVAGRVSSTLSGVADAPNCLGAPPTDAYLVGSFDSGSQSLGQTVSSKVWPNTFLFLGVRACLDDVAEDSESFELTVTYSAGSALRTVATTTVTIRDQVGGVSGQPWAHIDDVYVDEGGDVVEFDATGSIDLGGGPLTYSWTGPVVPTTPGRAAFDPDGVDGPSIVAVSVEVCDQDGLCDTASASAVVQNVAPSVDFDVPAVVTAGVETEIGVTAVDPGPDNVSFVDLYWAGTGSGEAIGPDFASPIRVTFPEAGDYRLAALVVDDDGAFRGDATTVTVTGTAPPDPEGPVVTDFTGERVTEVSLGDRPFILAGGYEQGAAVRAYLDDRPDPLFQEVADSNGRISGEFTVANDLTLGEHRVLLIGTAPDGGTRILAARFTVIAPHGSRLTAALDESGACGGAVVIVDDVAVSTLVVPPGWSQGRPELFYCLFVTNLGDRPAATISLTAGLDEIETEYQPATPLAPGASVTLRLGSAFGVPDGDLDGSVRFDDENGVTIQQDDVRIVFDAPAISGAIDTWTTAGPTAFTACGGQVHYRLDGVATSVAEVASETSDAWLCVSMRNNTDGPLLLHELIVDPALPDEIAPPRPFVIAAQPGEVVQRIVGPVPVQLTGPMQETGIDVVWQADAPPVDPIVSDRSQVIFRLGSGLPVIRVTDGSGSEGDLGSRNAATFEVSLVDPITGEPVVGDAQAHLATEARTGTTGVDFEATEVDLDFSTESTHLVRVPLIGDFEAEGDETFALSVGAVDGARSLARRRSGPSSTTT